MCKSCRANGEGGNTQSDFGTHSVPSRVWLLLLAGTDAVEQVPPAFLKTALKKTSHCDILSRVRGSLAQLMEQNLQRDAEASLKRSGARHGRMTFASAIPMPPRRQTVEPAATAMIIRIGMMRLSNRCRGLESAAPWRGWPLDPVRPAVVRTFDTRTEYRNRSKPLNVSSNTVTSKLRSAAPTLVT
jgi:hypothetical protein